MTGRNDSCPCGSGKKYKKCCLDSDTQRVAEVNQASVDVFRPAAFPLGHAFQPAIACMREQPEECLFVLVRASRPLGFDEAIDEAGQDLDSSPGSAEESVGPDCLRYLDKIGYRNSPGLGLEGIRLASEPEDEAGICPHCGSNHVVELDDTEELADEACEKADEEGADDDDLETEVQDAVDLIQRITGPLPASLLNMGAIAQMLRALLGVGYEPEYAIVRLLEAAANETERARAQGEAEPSRERFVAAISELVRSSADPAF